MGTLPTGFWTIFVSLVAATTAFLLAVRATTRWDLVALQRARRLLRSDAASTVVEFPFALLMIIMFALLTWQLAFLLGGYLVVDRAAFASVRAAIVSMGKDAYDTKNGTSPDATGLAGEAAAMVCAPISGTMGFGGGAVFEAWLSGQAFSPDTGRFREQVGLVDMVRRSGYAEDHTEVRVSEGSGRIVTATVTHEFYLAIPFADRVLGDTYVLGGRAATLNASASMLSEAFDEVEPKADPGVGGGDVP